MRHFSFFIRTFQFRARKIDFGKPAIQAAIGVVACAGWLSLQSGAGRAQVFDPVVRISPAVRLMRYVDAAGPVVAWVAEVNLRDPRIRLRSVKAGDRIAARERTSDMVRRVARGGSRVLVGINADFFAEDGTPVNMQISDGEVLRMPRQRALFVVHEDGTPEIGYYRLDAVAIFPDGSTLPIDGINQTRKTGQLVFYNRYRGPTTGTNAFGVEALLRPLRRFRVNDTLFMVVEEVRGNGPPLALGGGWYALSGHDGAASALQRRLVPGDTVRLLFDLEPGRDAVREAVGGTPWLIHEGKRIIRWREEGAQPGFALNRHPRSAVGFTRGADTLFLVAVDGRQEGYSVGMTLAELSDFLAGIGCFEAMNLDGGGSTTLVVHGEVVNRPSDAAGERPVSNALLVVEEAEKN